MDPFTDRLQAGDDLVGNWVSIADPAVAEIAALLEFDFVLVDMEHTVLSLSTATEMVRVIDAAGTGTATVVRAPWNDPVVVKRVLDAGVDGVMVLMIETAEQAREFVAAARYPPDGVRGVAAGRAADYGLALEEYVGSADDRIATIA